MAGLSANTHQLYSTASSGNTVGSRIKIGWGVFPQKTSGAAVVGNYPIQFDDVAPSAASNTWSGISTDSATGDIILKNRNGEVSISGNGLSFGSTGYTFVAGPNAVQLVMGADTFYFQGDGAVQSLYGTGPSRWLGGISGVSGNATPVTNIGAGSSNVTAPFVPGILRWYRIGDVVNVTCHCTIDVTAGATATDFDFTFAEQSAMLNGNFAASELIGYGSTSGTGGVAVKLSVRSVVGTVSVQIANVADPALAGGAQEWDFNYSFMAMA